MSEMSEAHDKEMKERGWSRWAVMALGAHNTLIPRIGHALREVTESVEGFDTARTLIDQTIEPDFDTLDEERAWWKSNVERMNKAFDYLSDNLEETLSLRTPDGFSPIKSLGEALMFFGENTIGYPPYGEYAPENNTDNGDAGYARWKSDSFKMGEILATENVDEMPEAFDWLKEWVYNIWD